jgi:hypothetical protein
MHKSCKITYEELVNWYSRLSECDWRLYANLYYVGMWKRGGTRWRSWLRHCTTNRNVAGSIPDGVIGIFQWHNPFGRTVTLGSTLRVTEMSTRNIVWGVWRPVLRADNLTTFMCRVSKYLGASTSWNPKGLPRPPMSLDPFSYSWVPTYRSAIVRIHYKHNVDCAYDNGFRVLAEDLDMDVLRYCFPSDR